MHNRLVLNNTNMAYRAASLSVFPNLPWLAWFKRIVCPLTRTMIATGLLVNLLWPPWHIVDSMSACRVYVCAAGMVALGSLLLGAGLVPCGHKRGGVDARVGVGDYR